MFLKSKYCLAVLITFVGFMGFSQSPGGVSNGLRVWSKANDGTNTTVNGQPVTSWVNQAGGLLTSLSYSNNNLQPTYLSQSLNFNPAIRAGAGAGLGQNSVYSSNVTNSGAQITHVYVGTAGAGGSLTPSYNVQMTVTNATNTSPGTNLLETGTYFSSTIDPFGGVFNWPYNTNQINVNYFESSRPLIWGISYTAGANTSHDYRINGFRTPINYNNPSNHSGNNFQLNADTDGGPHRGAWDYNEVISYERRLTQVELQRVETYLSIKYGFTLNNGSVDYVASNWDGVDPVNGVVWDVSANTGYNNDITAIGRDAASALLQKQSKSINTSSLVTIGKSEIVATNAANTGAFAADRDFLVFGDNNGGITSFSSSSAPKSLQKLSRTWKVAESGTDASDYVLSVPSNSSTLPTKLPVLPNSGDVLYLLVDNDAYFADAAKIIEMSLEGANWVANNVDLDDGQYFTFAAGPVLLDNDNDGIFDIIDLDNDNDGIPDTDEGCLPDSANFSISGGNSTTVTLNNDSDGMVLDVTMLDNSFNLNINGTPLTSSEINFHAPLRTVEFADGTFYGSGGISNIWSLAWNNPTNVETPLIRLIINSDGSVEIFGSKTRNGPLEPMVFVNGLTVNSITWNTGTNTVVLGQMVDGNTQMSGRLSSLVARCTLDTDSDGITDNLDLDSDGDGCFDALEGDAPETQIGYTELNPDGSIAGSVDADGIPTTAGGGQGRGTSQDNTQQAAECSPCDVNNLNYVDSDGDLVGDFCDLDDDNDGILDSEECGTGLIDFSNLNFTGQIVTLTNGATVTVDGTITTVPSSTASGDANGNLRLSDGNNSQPDPPEYSVGELYTLDFLTPIYVTVSNITANIAGFDAFFAGGDEWRVTADGGFYINDPDGQLSIQSIGPNYVEFRPAADTAIGPNSGTWSISTRNSVSSFTLQASGNPASAVNVSISCSDTDGDGTSDQLDTDSDNDGCNDVLEAGFTDNNGDGEVDGSGYATNGTVLGSDGYTTPNDADSNGTYDFQEAGTSPIITVQPINASACPGCNTNFAVTATNSDSYQWQRFDGTSWIDIIDGGIYSGATTSTLVLTQVTTNENGSQYRVLVSSSSYVCSELASLPATLTVRVTNVITNRQRTYRVNKN